MIGSAIGAAAVGGAMGEVRGAAEGTAIAVGTVDPRKKFLTIAFRELASRIEGKKIRTISVIAA